MFKSIEQMMSEQRKHFGISEHKFIAICEGDTLMCMQVIELQYIVLCQSCFPPFEKCF